MVKHATKIKSVIIISLFVLSMSSLLVSFAVVGTGVEVMNDEDCNVINGMRYYVPSAHELTTWYHDGSNTTG